MPVLTASLSTFGSPFTEVNRCSHYITQPPEVQHKTQLPAKILIYEETPGKDPKGIEIALSPFTRFYPTTSIVSLLCPQPLYSQLASIRLSITAKVPSHAVLLDSADSNYSTEMFGSSYNISTTMSRANVDTALGHWLCTW